MPKSCFDGYLTDGCATCPDWADGTGGRGIGCATRYPIDWCPYFKKMWEEEERMRKDNGMDEIVSDDLLPDEPIPPEAWAEPDQNEVITTRFHIDEWPVT